MPSDTTTTILQAAANLLRDDTLERVRSATSDTERQLVTIGLLASMTIDKYLQLVDDVERPF